MDAKPITLHTKDHGIRCLEGLFDEEADDLPEPPITTRTACEILFLTPSLGMGGAERWIASLVRWLPFRCSVVLLNPDLMNPTICDDVSRHADIVIDRPENLQEVEQVYSEAKIIIAWGSGNLHWVMKKTSAKVVWVAHTSMDIGIPEAEAAIRNGYELAAVSKACLRTFPESHRDKVRIIENGAAIERCTPRRSCEEMRAEWGIGNDKTIVAYVGRLAKDKRPEALAEAIAKLPDNYVGLMVGSGIAEAEVRRICQHLAGDRIKFAGFVSHVGDVYGAVDCWFNASYSEGWCLSLAEAMLAGLPCVSTNTGSIPDLTEANGAVVYILPDKPTGDQMAEVILRACERSSSEIERRAQQIAFDHYTDAAMGYRWEKYLREVREGA